MKGRTSLDTKYSESRLKFGNVPRAYSSPVRAERSQQNRQQVIAAAHEMFSAEGWTATTMARVAENSQVARQTVYLMFANKLALLDACIDAALNEGLGVPVRELPEYRAMGEGNFAERLKAGAKWLAQAHIRSARIQQVLDEAAVTDPTATSHLKVREQRRWQEVRFATSLILKQAEPDDALVDAVWTLASRDVWLKLTAKRGWTPEQWQAWFVRVVAATVKAA